jgi:hypothetical protein
MKKIFFGCLVALAMFAFVACNNAPAEEVVEAEATEQVDSAAVAVDSVATEQVDTTVAE